MGIFFHSLSTSLVGVSLALAALALVLAWRHAGWARLKQPTAFYGWLGATTLLAATWLFSVKVQPDFILYFLGTPLVTLMFGPGLAIVSVAIALGFYIYTIDGQWANLGLNLLLTGVLPALVSHGVLLISQRHLPRNYFVFLFVGGFFGGLMSVTSVMVVSVLLHAVVGFYDASYLLGDVLPSALLLAWGEALTLGMMTSMITIYAPALMLSFDDKSYLARKPPRIGDRPKDGHEFGDPRNY